MLPHYPTPVRLQLWAPNLLRHSFSRLLERLPQFQLTAPNTLADVLLAIELDSPSPQLPPSGPSVPVALIIPSQCLTDASERWRALALLSLEDDLETLAEGIHAAFSRQQFRSPRLSAAPVAPCLSPLSPCESDVACWVCKGLSNAQIAEQMHLSEGTVKSHLVHIFRKLDIQRRGQLIHWCQKYNFR